MSVYPDITATTGNTPLVRLNRTTQGPSAEARVTPESFNPLSSVKGRIAVSMISAAERHLGTALLDADV